MASLIQNTQLLAPDFDFTSEERTILRDLAAEVAALAARPEEIEKADLWRRHNDLEPTRPLVFCDPENSWGEIIPPDSLRCQSDIARKWETALRKEVFWGTCMQDDRVIEPYFNVEHVRSLPDWGLVETKFGGEAGGSYIWDAPVKSWDDAEKLHAPVIRVDFAATDHLRDLAGDLFGDLLTVRVKTSWWWSLGMTWQLANLRGLEQIMFDLIDDPDLIHRLMAILRDGTLAMVDALQECGLLYRNTGGTYVGSGGFGWTNQLPPSDHTGPVRTQDMWGFTESQETVAISPRMFKEFIFPYQYPIMERFGLTCYGCCEPLDNRWKYVKDFPNLRRVSVSPWADRAFFAAQLEDRYVYSMKPNPTDVAMDHFDEDHIRQIIRRDLELTRGCHVEMILKDTHTIRNQPERVTRWVAIALEEAARL
jgi:hypothetical protein